MNCFIFLSVSSVWLLLLLLLLFKLLLLLSDVYFSLLSVLGFNHILFSYGHIMCVWNIREREWRLTSYRVICIHRSLIHIITGQNNLLSPKQLKRNMLFCAQTPSSQRGTVIKRSNRANGRERELSWNCRLTVLDCFRLETCWRLYFIIAFIQMFRIFRAMIGLVFDEDANHDDRQCLDCMWSVYLRPSQPSPDPGLKWLRARMAALVTAKVSKQVFDPH